MILKNDFGMIQPNASKIDLTTELSPETWLEHQLLRHPEFVQGLLWGIPRYGHPEGEIYRHVREVLNNIDQLPIDATTRQKLRLIAFVHDTFKHREDKSHPRDWSKHHGTLARRFTEQFIDDRILLEIIEHHDEAYYCWRAIQLYEQKEAGNERLQKLFDTVGNELQLYYLFFKCDTRTGDKNQAPLKWFEKNIAGIDVLDW